MLDRVSAPGRRSDECIHQRAVAELPAAEKKARAVTSAQRDSSAAPAPKRASLFISQKTRMYHKRISFWTE
jgi:hypothetical protein